MLSIEATQLTLSPILDSNIISWKLRLQTITHIQIRLKMAPQSRIILTRHAQAEHNVDYDYNSE